MLRSDDGNVVSGSLWNSDVKGMHHVRSSEGGTDEWTTRPLLAEDGGVLEKGRLQAGLRKKTRRERNGQAYDHRDPEKLCALKVPAEFHGMLRTVFGPERCKTLKFAIHPHLKRICLYERHRDPKDGRLEAWRLIWVCSSKPTGAPAQDYLGNRELEHTGKFVGEFKWPEIDELIDIERFDRKKYGVAEVELRWHRIDHEEEQAELKRMDDFTAGFLDYYFNMARDEANQNQGSGQRMSSYATIALKSNFKKWKREEKNGYTVITKLQGDEYKDVLREDLGLPAVGEFDLRRQATRERMAAELKLKKRVAYEAILEVEQVRVAGDTYRKLTRREAAAFFRQNVGAKR